MRTLKSLRYNILKAFQALNYLLQRFLSEHLGYLIFVASCIAGIVFLAVNIVRVVSAGYSRYQLFVAEKGELTNLESERREWQQELDYYESKDFVDYKAREDLNLVFPEDKLIEVEREEEVETADVPMKKERVERVGWRVWYELLFR